MAKFKVQVTETRQKIYLVDAKNRAEAMSAADLGKPLSVKDRCYKSVY